MAVADITEVRQYLTFRLEEEVFAIDVIKVREVLDYIDITKVPQAPDFMRGIINVRGSVVPIVDMRLKFGMSRTEKTVNTCIIVMEIEVGDDVTTIGALADAVKEVVDLRPDEIEPAPRIGSKWKTEFIKGIGKRQDEFVIILAIDRIFSTNEIMALTGGETSVAHAPAPEEALHAPQA